MNAESAANDASAQFERLAIFPLHAVLFPGGVLPLRVFEARYMDMARDCLRRKRPFGVCLIREGREVGEPAIPEPVGCLAHIVECDMQQLGVLQLLARGGDKFRILESSANGQGLIQASVELLPVEPEFEVPEQFAPCAQLLQTISAISEAPDLPQPHRFNDAAWVSYRLAELLPLPPGAKQQLLALENSRMRLGILKRFLQQQGLIPAD